jgi:hypothetical protein
MVSRIQSIRSSPEVIDRFGRWRSEAIEASDKVQ